MCVCVCVCACVRTCVRACVRACVCNGDLLNISTKMTIISPFEETQGPDTSLYICNDALYYMSVF